MLISKVMRSALLTLCLLPWAAWAQDTIQVIYVNGIHNNWEEADENRKELQKLLDTSATHATERKKFAVQLIYNPTGFGSGNGRSVFTCELCQELKELFVLKVAEEKFSADFAKILAPHNASRQIDKAAAIRIRDSFVSDLTPSGTSLALSDESMAPTKVVIDKLFAAFKSGSKTIAVAHSQGNLIANLAYVSLVGDLGQDAQNQVRIVNIANTSKFAVSGLNLTHIQDAALFTDAVDSLDKDFSLETLPVRKGWSRDSGGDGCAGGICPFSLAPATFAGGDGLPGDLDHEFVATYMSTEPLDIVRVEQGIAFPGKTRFVDRFEDLIYAAAISLDITAGAGKVVRDIWTTSVFSFTGAGGGPGGGLNNDELVVGGWGDEYRSLLQFDLSTSPKTASSAKIRLYNISTHAGSGGPISMFLDRVTASWDWTTQPIAPGSPDNLRLWWANRPTFAQVSLIAAPSVGGYYEIDITSLYNQWQSGAVPNFGVQLRPINTNNYWNIFASSENADAARRPQLIVTAGGALPAGCSIASPQLPCQIDGITYDSFVGNYTQNRSFYQSSAYTVSEDQEAVCLTIIDGFQHNSGFAYLGNYAVTSPVWTSPPPHNVPFGIFGVFGGSCVTKTAGFAWLKPSLSQGGLVWMSVAPIDYTWSDANAICATTVNGQSGWRLPTIAELSSLYASGLMRNQGWSLFWTWSSTFAGTANPGGDTYSIMHLDDGRISVNYASGGANRDHVTCVR